MEKILHVENYEFSHGMLSRRLKRKGFDVVCAFNHEDAIKITHDEQPDLILMEMDYLAIQNSMTAIREIKASPKTQHIPIIALAAYWTTEYKEKLLQAGCEDVDTKPIELPSLLEKMNRLLSTEKTES
jgi:two-component system, cell cycle response regulator DivK